jgi:hypothetical protein
MQIHTKRKSLSLLVTLWLYKRRTNLALAMTVLALWGFLKLMIGANTTMYRNSYGHPKHTLTTHALDLWHNFVQPPSRSIKSYYPPYSTRTNADHLHGTKITQGLSQRFHGPLIEIIRFTLPELPFD